MAFRLLFMCFLILSTFMTSVECARQKRATGGMSHLLLDLFNIQTNATLAQSTGIPQFVSLLERLLSQNQQITTLLSVLAKGMQLTAGDCSDVAAQGPYSSGVYEITPWDDMGIKGSFKAFCDMADDGGGWTVIQRRMDGSVDFYLGWEDYKNGFGNLDGEFWIGLHKLYRLTNKTKLRWQLKVELEDFDGNTAYADYNSFGIGDESTNFQLTIGSYSGTAGDSLASHNNMQFSTKDRDNDPHSGNCATSYGGAWWYFSGCHYSNLNGPYLTSATSTAKSICWYHWKTSCIALKKAQMKIKPMM